MPARRYCNHAKGTKQGAKGKRPSNARGTRKILKQIKLLKAATINLSPTPIKRRANARQHDVQRVVERPRHAEVEAVRAARGRPGVRVDAQAEHRRDVDDPVARGEEGRGRGAVGHVDDLVAVLVLAGRRRGQLRDLREGRRGAAALGPGPPAFVGMMIAAMASWGISLVVDRGSPRIKKDTGHKLRRGHGPGREPLDVPRELVERLLVDRLELQRGREGLLRLVAAFRLRFS